MAANSASDAANSTQLGEVVVTARKRAENLQKVPIAISAFSGGELETRSIHRFNEIAQTTPGLVIAKQTSDPNSPVIQLRGQAQTTVQVATEPSVGVYLDGVYSGGSLGSNIGDLVDVNRVEVLRGPQGTLYGRNTTGGAINLFTNTPTNRYEGRIGIGLGDYSRRNADVVLNLPIVSDKVDLRVVGSVNTHHGYANQKVLDGANQPDVGEKDPLSQDVKSARATLKIQPNSQLQVMLRGDYSILHDHGGADHPVYFSPNTAANNYTLTAAAVQLTGKGAASITPDDRAAALSLLNSAVNSNLLDVYNSYHTHTRGEAGGGSATVAYDLGGATIKSISAYRHAESDRTIDDCGCGFDLLDFSQKSSFDLVSQELQVGGTLLDGKLKYTVGGYYFYKHGRNYESTYAFPPLNLASNPTVNAYTFKDRSFAAFSQATYSVTSKINVTGGLRYTDEKNTLTAHDFNSLSCNLPAPDLVTAPAEILPGCKLYNIKKDNNLSYTGSIDWAITQEVLVYGRTDRGFQAGGVNLRPTSNPASASTYKPEVNTDYEIGLKSQWLDRRLRFNVDYYHSKLKDAQRNVLETAAAPVVAAGTLALTNAASAKIDGVEFELSVIPAPRAFISAAGAYTNARYDHFVVGGVDQSFLNFQVTPKWSYTLTAGYTEPTPLGPLKGEVDWSWRSSQDLYPQDAPGAVNAISVDGTASVGAGTPDSARIQRSYGLLNASVMLTIDSYDTDIRLFITNLLDKRYLSFEVGTVNGGTGITSGVAGDPRVFGVDIVKRF